MDIRSTQAKLHPQIKTFLFQHFAVMTTIFRDVLGLLEIDYLSITLLTRQNELLCFSSKPSIEWNLIEKDLWQFDNHYHLHGFEQGGAKKWSELYQEQRRNELHYIKQTRPGLNFGLSIPSNFNDLSVIYAFATESTQPKDIKNMINHIDDFTSIGRFCLQKIINAVDLSKILNAPNRSHPILKLIINEEKVSS